MIDPAHFIEYELLMEVNRSLHAGKGFSGFHAVLHPEKAGILP